MMKLRLKLPNIPNVPAVVHVVVVETVSTSITASISLTFCSSNTTRFAFSLGLLASPPPYRVRQSVAGIQQAGNGKRMNDATKRREKEQNEEQQRAPVMSSFTSISFRSHIYTLTHNTHVSFDQAWLPPPPSIAAAHIVTW